MTETRKTDAPGDDLAQRIGAGQVAKGTATAFDLVASMEAEFAKALPAHIPVETFMRTAITELRTNAGLQACSGVSLLGAFMTAARLGLEVGGPLGEFYLTPRRVKGEASVVPIVGYRGLVKLARNTGQVGAVKAFIIREGDHFVEGANSERGPYFDFEPLPDPDRPPVGVLAVARLAGGDVQHVRLTMAEVEARKTRGAAGDRGPWATDREAMIRKTGIRALAGDLPQSSALALARVADERVQVYRGGELVPEDPAEIVL